MKLYRCAKCSLVYARDSDEIAPVTCNRSYTKVSYTGIIGEYTEYCGGVLVPVTLDAPPSPVEQDHGDRRGCADREGEPEVSRAYHDRCVSHRRERADALSGSRRHYWQKVVIEAFAREGNAAYREGLQAERAQHAFAREWEANPAAIEARWKAGWASLVHAEDHDSRYGAGGPDG